MGDVNFIDPPHKLSDTDEFPCLLNFIGDTGMNFQPKNIFLCMLISFWPPQPMSNNI
jgi:hypothetical protein